MAAPCGDGRNCGDGMVPRVTARAGEAPSVAGYKVLDPIRQGNLTVFPVVTMTSHDTHEFLTLDEGVRSGEVVVTEYGNLQPLMRRRELPLPRSGGAQVNQLVLVNNSKQPLILLAGEIVTGGKQDRVIGKDRIVPAESDPIDLNVFCVEPDAGRQHRQNSAPLDRRWRNRPSGPKPWVRKTSSRSGSR